MASLAGRYSSLFAETATVRRFVDGAWQEIEAGDAFPTSPDDGDFFRLTKTVGTDAPGVYKRVSGAWVLQSTIGAGASFPTTRHRDGLRWTAGGWMHGARRTLVRTKSAAAG